MPYGVTHPRSQLGTREMPFSLIQLQNKIQNKSLRPWVGHNPSKQNLDLAEIKNFCAKHTMLREWKTNPESGCKHAESIANKDLHAGIEVEKHTPKLTTQGALLDSPHRHIKCLGEEHRSGTRLRPQPGPLCPLTRPSGDGQSTHPALPLGLPVYRRIHKQQFC